MSQLSPYLIVVNGSFVVACCEIQEAGGPGRVSNHIEAFVIFKVLKSQ